MISKVLRGIGLDRQYAPPPPGNRRGGALEHWYPGHGSIAGEQVTTEKALGVGTVYACIRILADTTGSTPILAYREGANRERQRDPNSVAWSLLHEQPNPAHSPVDFQTMLATWLVAWGDAFIGKQFAPSGELVALWPIHPEYVAVGLVNGQKRYEVRGVEGRPKRYGPADLIHVMGQSFDGVRGASPLTIARQELAISLAAQRYAGAVYKNTGVPRGALKVKRQLSDEAIARVRADWNRIYGGSANAGKVAILEEDMEFDQVSMPMRDVQFVEQQQLSVQTLARIFRVPLSLIQADTPGGMTYRTAETENLQFLTHGVRPWYVRIEQALNRDLDLFPSRPVTYCEHLPDALLKVATKERFDAYSVATGQKAWMLPQEVRKAENLPELEEEELEQLTAAKAASATQPTAPIGEGNAP